MIALWGLVSGSKLGQLVIKIVLGMGAIAMAVWVVFASGKRQGAAEVKVDVLEHNATTRENVDEAAAKFDGAGAGQRLRDGTF